MLTGSCRAMFSMLHHRNVHLQWTHATIFGMDSRPTDFPCYVVISFNHHAPASFQSAATASSGWLKNWAASWQHVRPAKTQISLGIRPVWSESSLFACRKLGSLATHLTNSEDSDQTGRMPRLIWVFAGRKLTMLVLSCRGPNCAV